MANWDKFNFFNEEFEKLVLISTPDNLRILLEAEYFFEKNEMILCKLQSLSKFVIPI